MPPLAAPLAPGAVDPSQPPDPTNPPQQRVFSSLPTVEQQRITGNIATMRAKGAQPSEIDDYLANHEHLAPVVPSTPPGRIRSFAAEGTAAAPDQAARRAAMAAAPPILSSGLPRELEQGATLGYGDELNAGARATFTKESYADALANERGIMHAYEQAHPIVSVGAQLAGGAATGLGAARVLPAAANASRAVRLARVVGEGAGVGAVAGSGTAEGGVGDRLEGAKRGAIAGAVLAPAVVGTAALGRKIVAPYLSRAIDASGVRAPATPVAPMLDDQAGVPLTLPQKVGRRVGVQSVQGRADNLVLKTLTKDGTSIDDLRAAANAASPDKPVALADIGGEGGARLVRGARGYTESAAATKVPKIIRGRAEASGTRLAEDMTTASGVQPVNPYELADQMRSAQMQQADANYRTAYAKGAVPDETLTDMLKLPYFDDAWKFAQRLAKLEGRQLPERITQVVKPGTPPPTPPGFSDEQWAAARARMPENEVLNPPGTTQEVKETVPDVEAVDMVKRGVDKQIENNLAKGSIDKAAAVKLTQRLHDFLGKVDATVPEYGTARSQYAAAERMHEALDAGRGAIGKDPRVIEREIAQLETDHEKGLYRYGLQDALNQTIAGARDGAPIANTLAGSETSRRQLAAIAKDAPSAQELLKRAGEERQMSRTNDIILGNSSTAENVGAQRAIADAGGEEPATPRASGRGVAMYLFGRLKAAAAELNPNTADAVANRLLAGTSNRQELLDALDQLDGLRKKGQLTRAKTRALLGLPVASEAGRVVSPKK